MHFRPAHGPPVIRLAREADARPTWCVFDSTAEGTATVNALEVLERLRVPPSTG